MDLRWTFNMHSAVEYEDINTTKSLVLVLSWKRVGCSIQVKPCLWSKYHGSDSGVRAVHVSFLVYGH